MTNPATPSNVDVGTVVSYVTTIAMNDEGAPNAHSGSFSMPVVDSDQVTINAETGAAMNYDIDIHPVTTTTCNTTNDNDAPYTVEVGLVTTGTVKTATDAICIENIDASGTATDAVVLSVSSLNDALVSSGQPTYTIPNTGGGVINPNTEEYGICATGITQYAGTITMNPSWRNCTADQVGTFGTAGTGWARIAASNVPIVDGVVENRVKVSVSPSTETENDYTDTLTFRVIGTF